MCKLGNIWVPNGWSLPNHSDICTDKDFKIIYLWNKCKKHLVLHLMISLVTSRPLQGKTLAIYSPNHSKTRKRTTRRPYFSWSCCCCFFNHWCFCHTPPIPVELSYCSFPSSSPLVNQSTVLWCTASSTLSTEQLEFWMTAWEQCCHPQALSIGHMESQWKGVFHWLSIGKYLSKWTQLRNHVKHKSINSCLLQY